MISGRTWTSLLVAAALAAGCGHDDAPAAPPPFPPADRAKFVDAAVLAAMPVPSVVDDAKLRSLLEASPDAAALEYFSEDLLYEKDDTRFISMLMTLVGSKNADIARMSADMVAGAYVVAASAGVDVGPAIDVALKSPSAATRRAVVRNLGLPECAPVRAWLREHEHDDAADEIDPAHPTVADEVRIALIRLNAAAAEARSVVPSDQLAAFECGDGKSEHVPAPGAEATLQIAATDVHVGTTHRSAASPEEPVVMARLAMQMPNGIAILLLPKKDAPVFAFGLNSTKNSYLLVWSRAVSRDRVRFWVRCKPPSDDK
jgi:hypothetical protein